MNISRHNLDDFLQRSIQHYSSSLVMRYANATTRAKLMEFMNHDFLPAWRSEVMAELSSAGVNELDDTVVLEGIHSRLYLERGYAERELEIFKASDPAGHRRFMAESTREIMEEKT